MNFEFPEGVENTNTTQTIRHAAASSSGRKPTAKNNMSSNNTARADNCL